MVFVQIFGGVNLGVINVGTACKEHVLLSCSSVALMLYVNMYLISIKAASESNTTYRLRTMIPNIGYELLLLTGI